MIHWTSAVAILPYAWIHVYFKRLTPYLVPAEIDPAVPDDGLLRTNTLLKHANNTIARMTTAATMPSRLVV